MISQWVNFSAEPPGAGSRAEPSVSVVTPFYNTEDFLAECIESVLRQSYRNFEYILSNNRSTDRSLQIAEEYARRDPRIRLIDHKEFLDQIGNYNRALRDISPSSKYLKIVQADDWLYPECLEKMVPVAEDHPSVSIVSAYCLRGREIANVGLPHSTPVYSGREICRDMLLGGRFFFGSPTSILLRADVVRRRNPFYTEGNLHEDTEACYDILRDSDFGFVHQVLTFTRVDNDSITSNNARFDADQLDYLLILVKKGPHFLTEAELAARLDRIQTNYFRMLAKNVLIKRKAGYWDYHEKGLRTIGRHIRKRDLIPYLLPVVADLILNPKRTFEKAAKAVRTRKTRSIGPRRTTTAPLSKE